MSGNPLKYLEPIGFIVAVIFGFGWGRPTPTSPLYYKDRQKGIVITYLTPSFVNLLAGFVAALAVGVLSSLMIQTGHVIFLGQWAFWLLSLLLTFAHISISTAIFNMIPVPPLDAAKLLQSSLSPTAAVKMTQNEKLLQLVLMLLVVTQIVGQIIHPISSMLINVARGF